MSSTNSIAKAPVPRTPTTSPRLKPGGTARRAEDRAIPPRGALAAISCRRVTRPALRTTAGSGKGWRPLERPSRPRVHNDGWHPDSPPQRSADLSRDHGARWSTTRPPARLATHNRHPAPCARCTGARRDGDPRPFPGKRDPQHLQPRGTRPRSGRDRTNPGGTVDHPVKALTTCLATRPDIEPVSRASENRDQGSDLRKRWSRLGESNPGPTHYECVALPTELRRRARRASSEILIKTPTQAQRRQPAQSTEPPRVITTPGSLTRTAALSGRPRSW